MRDDAAHEVAWLRGLMVQVAEGLERLAAAHEADRVKFEQAAMWLRRQLHRGPPPPDPDEGMGVGQGPATSKTQPLEPPDASLPTPARDAGEPQRSRAAK